MSFLNNIKPENIDYYDVDNELDYQKAVNIEVSKTLKHKQQKQMADMRDSDNYCVLCFVNEHDKNEFLSKISQKITNFGSTFLDGYEFAKSIGIDIEMSATLQEPHFSSKLSKKINIKSNKIKLK